MILQRLAEHYDRLLTAGEPALPRIGYSQQKVSFCIVLQVDGTLNSFEDLRRRQGKVLRPQTLLVPGQNKSSGSGLNPCFLWDSSEYLLGFSTDPVKRGRAVRAFGAFRESHLRLEATLGHPYFSAVCAFLRSWAPATAKQYEPELTEQATNFGVFRIAGQRQYIHEVIQRPDEAQQQNRNEVSAMCLVTGARGPISRVHEPRIKGVTGSQTSGALLVSFNASAFTSYGKDQSFNAPVSTTITFKYGSVLNYLLTRRDRQLNLANLTVVYWPDHATVLEDIFATLVSGPGERFAEQDQDRLGEARLMLQRMHDGGPHALALPDGPNTRFYILGLAPNASRLSVRLWVEQDAAVVVESLSQHIQDQKIVAARNREPLPLWRLVAAAGRIERDPDGRLKSFDMNGVSPQITGDILQAVLTGGPYPQSLLATLVRRIRSDGDVGFARVSAIRACLVRNSRLRGAPMEVPVELDPQQPDCAYRCGRMFALLEKVQRDSSLGGHLNTTIKDHLFSSASAAPALVFPGLLRLNSHYLSRLGAPARIFYERQFSAAMVAPFEFPKQLMLEEQGRFVVGYFQQRQDLYTKKRQARPEENTIE